MDSIEDNLQDNIFLSNMFYNFFCESKHLICISRRLDIRYDINNIIHNILEKDHNIKNLQIKQKCNFLSFYIDFSENITNVFFNIFSKLWFSYEQPCFIFINEELQREAVISLQNQVLFSWQDFTQTTDSYVFYKGSREDVVWLGKSEKLDMPNII